MKKMMHYQSNYIDLVFLDPRKLYDLLKEKNTKKITKTFVFLFLFISPFFTIPAWLFFNTFNLPFSWIESMRLMIIGQVIGSLSGLCIGFVFCAKLDDHILIAENSFSKILENHFLSGICISLVVGFFSGVSMIFIANIDWQILYDKENLFYLTLATISAFFGYLVGSMNSLRNNSGNILFIIILSILLGAFLKQNILSGEPEYDVFLRFLPFFLLAWVVSKRLYYIPYYLLLYFNEKRETNPLGEFKKIPFYFDSTINVNLPYIESWMEEILNYGRVGIEELVFIANNRYFQQRNVMNVFLKKIRSDLRQIKSLKEMSMLEKNIIIFEIPENLYKKMPYDIRKLKNHLEEASRLSLDYGIMQTISGKKETLNKLSLKIRKFKIENPSISIGVSPIYHQTATEWLEIIENEKKKLNTPILSISNPYIVGNPINSSEGDIFVGRKGIYLALEEHVLFDINSCLLLYGRRRTGKSSTLLNLPHSTLESVYIDCQDAKWHESDQAFCYNLAYEIHHRLFQNDNSKGLTQPKIETYEKNTFTQLDQFLTKAQKLVKERNKRILLAFDEYEELETAILNGDISEKVLGKIRNLIQHSKSIVVLVSGSHRFEELPNLNWANYLINTRTLELSFLEEEPARKLLTTPVPELNYEAGVVDEIIRITHCQPFLLQAVASELVNYLNSQQRTTATHADLETALEKTLVAASAYFSDTWRKDNTETEQRVMRELAHHNELDPEDKMLIPSTQSLIRKEIVEPTETGYRLTVELFGRWIIKNQV